MAGRVTIKSIAKDLGISHMTVSRALSGHPNVQKETRIAVQARARELGYVKSAAATMMRGDRTKIVGLLLPNIVNEFYARFANAMALACEARSRHLIIHLTNDDIGTENQALERLREVQADSVVMVPTPGESPQDARRLEGMNVIQLIRQRQIPTASHVILVDDKKAISEAVMRLYDIGHRSIAYIGADAQLSSGRERLAAYHAGLDAVSLPATSKLTITGTPSFEMGRHSARSILDETDATSVVCGGFEISNGALSILMARNVSPNGAFRFVGYGDPTFYSWIDGGVSTIQVPVEQLALRAADLVLEGMPDPAKTRQTTAPFAARLLFNRSLEASG